MTMTRHGTSHATPRCGFNDVGILAAGFAGRLVLAGQRGRRTSMYAMQYEIGLLAGYDIAIIRHRVATKGPLLDTMPGLGLKAYLIREQGKNGSSVNLYAPFYLWASIQGMNDFLWNGGGFGGIVTSFGRPPVHHWTGVACLPGPRLYSAPTWATRIIEPIAPEVDPAEAVEDARNDTARRSRLCNVHSTAIAVDPWN